MDRFAVENQGDVDVIAIAWHSSLEATARAAERLLPSGAVRWTFDEPVFDQFGVVYQPVSVLIDEGVEVARWFGPVPLSEVSTLLDELNRSLSYPPRPTPTIDFSVYPDLENDLERTVWCAALEAEWKANPDRDTNNLPGIPDWCGGLEG